MSLRNAKRKLDRYLQNPEKVVKDLEKRQNQRIRTAERIVRYNKKKGNFLKARIFAGALFAFFIILYFNS